MKILIAVPSMDSVPAVFAQSLSMLKKVGNCAVAFQVGSLVYNSRNALGKRALEMGADYVLWLDSDIMFEPELLENMMKTLTENDLDFLTGIYYRRVEPYTPVVCNELYFDEEGKCYWNDFKQLPEGLFEVGGCGFGCVLMKAEVLLDVQGRFGDMFSPIHLVGEDYSFCWRVRECGYKIIADPSIHLGHVGNTIITKAYYEAFNQAKEREDERGA